MIRDKFPFMTTRYTFTFTVVVRQITFTIKEMFILYKERVDGSKRGQINRNEHRWIKKGYATEVVLILFLSVKFNDIYKNEIGKVFFFYGKL